MKLINRRFLPILLAMLPACSFHPTTASRRPAESLTVGESTPPTEGDLLVYSEREIFGDPRNVDPYSAYTVISKDGKTVEQVSNHLDRFDEGPKFVTLPPGSYTVTARSAHFGMVSVLVVIRQDQTTFVYLDGYPHPDVAQDLKTDLVKMPDGRVVGWSVRAAAE